MATFMVSRTSDQKRWEIMRQREGVSATVWDGISLPTGERRFKRATDARAAAVKYCNVVDWVMRRGRGSANYVGRDGSGWAQPQVASYRE